MKRLAVLGFCTLLVAVLVVALGCGGGGSSQPQTGFINAALSDPATCSSPGGPYSHVFVTVTDVKIHTSASAGGNDSGWIDLTPDLKNSPKQVDLLSQAISVVSWQCWAPRLRSRPGPTSKFGSFLRMTTHRSPEINVRRLRAILPIASCWQRTAVCML